VDMKQLELIVPTYYGERNSKQAGMEDEPDFGDPLVPVLVREADGVRIVLGSHDYDSETPDIQIERRPNGWAIFLHPLGGSDPSGFVYFLDDGRSFLVPEYPVGPTESIVVRRCDEGIPPEVDLADSDALTFIMRSNDDGCGNKT